jgi:leucine dehydrogenase
MTLKCAAAGLPIGGGKTVVAVPDRAALPEAARNAAMLDVGDIIEEFGGRYVTGPDAGTGTADMVTIGRRTEHVLCRPESANGSGDPSPYTARGVIAALRSTCQALTGSSELADRRFAIVGVGHVGEQIARQLSAAGARLLISDIDASKKFLADELGATFVSPDEAVTAAVDVIVPAALGGLITREVVPGLRCTAIAGAANNQLSEPDIADLLQIRNILWAPDYLANAGGVVYAVAREVLGDDQAKAIERVDSIANALTTVFEVAAGAGTTPSDAADDLAKRHLAGAGQR